MEEYEYVSTLGEGAYGHVWKCTQRETGEEVAIKGFKQIMRLAVREVKVLQSLDHPSVIRLIEAFKSKTGRVYMVFPYIGQSAYQALDVYTDGLPPARLKLLAWQMVQALIYLHSKKIVHRDIKPANILLGEGGTAKLCDFGFARGTHCGPRDAERLSSYVVTRWYRAPEILVGDHYGPASDIWSLGCTLAELATGTPLFPGRSSADQLWRIMRCFGPLAPQQAQRMFTSDRLMADGLTEPPPCRPLRDRLKVDQGLFHLIRSCLHVDPLSRPTAEELLQMPYFWTVPSSIAGTPMEKAYREHEQRRAARKQHAAAAAAAHEANSTQPLLKPQSAHRATTAAAKYSSCTDVPPVAGVATPSTAFVSHLQSQSQLRPQPQPGPKPASVAAAPAATQPPWGAAPAAAPGAPERTAATMDGPRARRASGASSAASACAAPSPNSAGRETSAATSFMSGVSAATCNSLGAGARENTGADSLGLKPGPAEAGVLASLGLAGCASSDQPCRQMIGGSRDVQPEVADSPTAAHTATAHSEAAAQAALANPPHNLGAVPFGSFVGNVPETTGAGGTALAAAVKSLCILPDAGPISPVRQLQETQPQQASRPNTGRGGRKLTVAVSGLPSSAPIPLATPPGIVNEGTEDAPTRQGDRGLHAPTFNLLATSDGVNLEPAEAPLPGRHVRLASDLHNLHLHDSELDTPGSFTASPGSFIMARCNTARHLNLLSDSASHQRAAGLPAPAPGNRHPGNSKGHGGDQSSLLGVASAFLDSIGLGGVGAHPDHAHGPSGPIGGSSGPAVIDLLSTGCSMDFRTAGHTESGYHPGVKRGQGRPSSILKSTDVSGRIAGACHVSPRAPRRDPSHSHDQLDFARPQHSLSSLGALNMGPPCDNEAELMMRTMPTLPSTQPRAGSALMASAGASPLGALIEGDTSGECAQNHQGAEGSFAEDEDWIEPTGTPEYVGRRASLTPCARSKSQLAATPRSGSRNLGVQSLQPTSLNLSKSRSRTRFAAAAEPSPRAISVEGGRHAWAEEHGRTDPGSQQTSGGTPRGGGGGRGGSQQNVALLTRPDSASASASLGVVAVMKQRRWSAVDAGTEAQSAPESAPGPEDQRSLTAAARPGDHKGKKQTGGAFAKLMGVVRRALGAH
ncbi:hypothetical protein HYH03_015812 [Edaphochlamys debaryana]|uniref:cyclin-dependent kinase n=1 Tax=Edaphochlamys debaryana TaxID=47281 RepID=A0A835XIP6_9CHLO|nr:hypothetical protein HYH03_015812 [Edaphochlamys debaryana]|eukprot:KAG2485432.1 hypothetical protein HYH03_015812 [Edaphochlamys debaryana]